MVYERNCLAILLAVVVKVRASSSKGMSRVLELMVEADAAAPSYPERISQ